MAESVAFLGLGSMGAGMAGNLLTYLKQEGKSLYVWNRSPDKAKPLVEKGALYTENIADVAARCSVVMTMLGTDAALQEVFLRFMSARQHPQGTIFVDHSTVAPALTASLAEQARARGVAYVSAPVFGRPDAAAAKQLLVVAAGDRDAKAQVQPLLQALGRGVIDVGGQPQHGSVAKLVGNFFISSLIEVFAEGMALGEKNGVAPSSIAEIVHQLFPGKIAPGYATRIAGGSFEITPDRPGFNVPGGIKDVGHILALGRASGVSMPVAEVTMQHLQAVGAREDSSQLDWGAVALVVREAARLGS